MLFRAVILAVCSLGPFAPPDGQPDRDLIESLRDAQATHREAWSRGRARLRLEISTTKKEGTARIEGEVVWMDSFFVLKYKVSDPDGVFFSDRAISFDQEGNFIARGKDFVITYASRNNVFHERKPTPGSFRRIFDLSPQLSFGSCCPPTASREHLWRDLIGHSPNLPGRFDASKFVYRQLPNGDVEQTRTDETGHWNKIVFSAKYDMAVASLILYDPKGKALQRLEYTYSVVPGQRIRPSTCVSEMGYSPKGEIYRYKYWYQDVRLPGDVTPSEFTRDAVMGRIRRETYYGRSRRQRANQEADDANLESAARELRERGTARPDTP
ncbi:MAG: hypothetical protein ACP5XB_10655 [Isosphaeraceae bacterium]